MYPQQPGWGAGHQQPQQKPPLSGFRIALILLAAALVMCAMCGLNSVVDPNRRRDDSENSYPPNQANFQPPQYTQHTQQIPQQPPQPAISRSFQSAENQRLARAALSAATGASLLTVADALAEQRAEPTLVIATLNDRSPLAETQAVSLCMTLMNTRPELSVLTHIVINGAGGVRLADGYRRQQRCFSVSTSIWQRM